MLEKSVAAWEGCRGAIVHDEADTYQQKKELKKALHRFMSHTGNYEIKESDIF